MKTRTSNGNKKMVIWTNNDLKITTQKTQDRAIGTPLNTGMNSGASEGLAVPVPIVTPVV